MLFFRTRTNRCHKTRSQARPSRRLLVEPLEDRLVLNSAPFPGQILVANTDRTTTNAINYTGVIGVDPRMGDNLGAQTPISIGGYFAADSFGNQHTPTNLCEAPDGTVYVTDVGTVAPGAKVPTLDSGAIVALSPTDGSQRLVASDLPGPNADAFLNGSLYVAYGGIADRKFHTLMKMNPSNGSQIPIGPSQPDNGQVSAATPANGPNPATLSNFNANWTDFTGWDVVIVDGKGAGQVRHVMSNTPTQLNLTSDWAVVPDSSSRYTLGFAVPVGMGLIPGDNNDVYVGDEQGGINYDVDVSGLSGEFPGAIWKVSLTTGAETIVTYGNSPVYGNKLTAVLQGPYGVYPPMDRTDDPQYGNMSDMAVDPTNGNIIALNTGCRNHNGPDNLGSLVGVDPISGIQCDIVGGGDSQNHTLEPGVISGKGLDGVAVGPGMYGPETIYAASGYTTQGNAADGGVAAINPVSSIDPATGLVQHEQTLFPKRSQNFQDLLFNAGGALSFEDNLVNNVNFETGDFSQLAGYNGNVKILHSPALDGQASLQLIRDGSQSGGIANAEIWQRGNQSRYNLPTAFSSFLFKSESQSGEAGVVNFLGADGSYKAALHLSSDGKLVLYGINGYGSLLGTGTTTLNPNQTYTISAEIGTDANTGGTAPYEILINGNVEMSGTADFGTENNGSLLLGGGSMYNSTYDYDDVAISAYSFPVQAPALTFAGNQASLEGATTTFALGSFSDATPTATAWTVDVSWGDGTPDTIFTTMAKGSLGAVPHTYAEDRCYTAGVTVTNSGGISGSSTFTVNVAEPALPAQGGFTFLTLVNTLLDNPLVATFTDPTGPDSVRDYSATINWGDGSMNSTTGTIAPLQDGSFEVRGSHTYTQSGTFAVTVVIAHDNAPTTTVVDTAIVSPGGDPATTTVVSSSGTPSVVGQAVTFTATVSPGGNIPSTDTVTFYDTFQTSPIGKATVTSSGGMTSAALTTSKLLAGSHAIWARFNGDSNYMASGSAPITQNVNPATTSVTLGSSANPVASGQWVTFTASVSVLAPGSTAAGSPTGTVLFTDNGTSIGQGTLSMSGGMAQATFRTSGLALGSHTITAQYNGDSNFFGSVSTSLSVNVQPAPLVTAPPNQRVSEGAAQFVSLGSFSDAGPGPWTAFVAWGDGWTTTLPAPSAPGSLGNQIHNYAEEGTFTGTIVVTDTGDNWSGSAPFTVSVQEVGVTATPMVGIAPTAGTPYSGAVATFTDPGGAEPNDGTHYSASINWGDNTAATAGTISVNSGVFTVSGTHTYASANFYTISVTILQDGWLFVTPVQSQTVQFVSAGLVKPTSFWEGLQGQGLIRRFGVTSSNQTLGQWLAAKFPNLYGGGGGAPNLSSFSDAQIGSYYQSLYLAAHGTGLDVEILATVLDDFTTTLSLGGNTTDSGGLPIGQDYGFTVNSYGLGAYSWNIASSGAAFGTPNYQVLTVYQILLATDNFATGGEPWGSNTFLRNETLTVFQGINAIS